MRKLILLCLLSASLGGLAAFGLHAQSNVPAGTPGPGQPTVGGPQPDVPAVPVAGNSPPPEAMTPDEQVNIFVYQQANRGVVNINTKGVSANALLFEVISKGQGSGVVIDRTGHILTNFHVIEGAKETRVTLYDGKTYNAQLVGGDPDTDVAVLKIDAPADSLFPVAFGTSTNLLVGQRVFAIGNPFGWERTLSTGIISSLDRSLPGKNGRRSLRSIIQIDAAINPGNSGGPLLDSHARMIGMNTAIFSDTGESVGVGFAIPVNTIVRVVPQLIQNGHVRRPGSGIAQVIQTDRGLLIAALVPGGTAERAGLLGPRIVKEQRGPFVLTTIDRGAADLIVAIDGRPIKTADDFLEAIEAKRPGDQVVITVIRAGAQQQIPLRLEGGQ